MMGTGHALSGAVTGFCAATLARDLGWLHISPAATVPGAALCAGAALLPATTHFLLFVLLTLALRGLTPNLQRKMGRPGGLRTRRRRRPRPPAWWRRTKGMLGVWLLAAVLTWLLADAMPASDVGAWLGAMVALGCLTHCAGDAITEMGCPMLWPVPVARQRWFLIGPPRILRFKAGGAVERWLVTPVLMIAAGASAVLALPDAASALIP